MAKESRKICDLVKTHKTNSLMLVTTMAPKTSMVDRFLPLNLLKQIPISSTSLNKNSNIINSREMKILPKNSFQTLTTFMSSKNKKIKLGLKTTTNS